MNKNKQVDDYLESVEGWQKNILLKLRDLIHEVEPEIVEEWKWDVPVFSFNGMVCATAAFANHAKINFFKGALVNDEGKLFNAGLDSKKTRAIDIFENDRIDEKKIKALLKQAILVNKK